MSTPEQLFAEAVRQHQAGDFSGAEKALKKVLKKAPGHINALQFLGMLLAQRGKLADAISLMQKAVKLQPKNAMSRFNLANALKGHGKLDAAVAEFRTAAGQSPDDPRICNGLAATLMLQDKLDEAETQFRQAISLEPRFADAYSNLGTVLMKKGEPDAAIESYREAIRRNPHHGEAMGNLGNALSEKGEYDEAVGLYEQAIAVDPGNFQARYNLGNTLVEHLRFNDAESLFRQVLAHQPDHTSARKNLMFTMCYNPERTPEQIGNEHKTWGEWLLSTLPSAPPKPHANNPDPDRPLRIGYLSPDFRAHAVACFVGPVLASHHREQVEVTCYASVAQPDDTTARLKKSAHHWVDVFDMDDDQLARKIRADQIDILIDVAGHTVGSRLPVMAQKPAPVQVTWLGYPATTGLAMVDYRLTDRFTDPGEGNRWCVEELVRLGGGFSCFETPERLPDVESLPAKTNGYITFGSLMNTVKINPGVIDLWARVLKSVPGSRLLISRKNLAAKSMQERFYQLFESAGIDRGRVTCEGARNASGDQFLSAYNRMDISLDTFPYAGHTTTCEAILMGVPVVTLAGEGFVERAGVSVLSLAGQTEWIAENEDEYVQKAVALAGDVEALAKLRSGLRAQVVASELCDAEGFCTHMETAYRAMWQRWCAAQNG